MCSQQAMHAWIGSYFSTCTWHCDCLSNTLPVLDKSVLILSTCTLQQTFCNIQYFNINSSCKLIQFLINSSECMCTNMHTCMRVVVCRLLMPWIQHHACKIVLFYISSEQLATCVSFATAINQALFKSCWTYSADSARHAHFSTCSNTIIIQNIVIIIWHIQWVTSTHIHSRQNQVMVLQQLHDHHPYIIHIAEYSQVHMGHE